MLYMHFTRKTIRGTMMKQLVRIGRLLPSILDRENVNLGKVYTTELSENYHPTFIVGMKEKRIDGHK